jgi:putative FmdB family regulatory protein
MVGRGRGLTGSISGSSPRSTIGAMPLYEYECEACGDRFEQLVGSTAGIDSEEVVCPRCGSRDVRKLMSGYAPVSRQLTPRQRRRLEAKRGVDRGGAKQRFKERRAARRGAGRGS